MLTLPDFTEKKIVFICGRKDMAEEIRFWNDNIRIYRDGSPVNQISCHKVLAVFIFGECTITSVLIRNCMKYGISLILARNNFEVYAVIGAEAEGNTLLRKKQYQLLDEMPLAKNLVVNKIMNQYATLSKAKITLSPKKCFKSVRLKINGTQDYKSLLGLEGSVTKDYFKKMFADLDWYRRLPRAKIDPTNLLMDMGYTMLFNFIDCLLRLFGFDVYKGFYHQLFFQRKSLACDLMEPFRCLIDAAILKAHHLKQINPKDFKKNKQGVYLSYDKQAHYLWIFSKAIMDNKEIIFKYVRHFYYYMLGEEKNLPFAEFSFK